MVDSRTPGQRGCLPSVVRGSAIETASRAMTAGARVASTIADTNTVFRVRARIAVPREAAPRRHDLKIERPAAADQLP